MDYSSEARESKSLQQKLKDFLQEREIALLDSELDYCYAPDFVANQICYQVTAQIFAAPETKDFDYYNLLLSQSCGYGDEKKAWHDATTREGKLAKNLFIRSRYGLLRIDSLVKIAVNNLKAGAMTLDKIWREFHQDNSQQPLHREILLRLKNCSSVLKRLIEYTEALDQYANSDVARRNDLLLPIVALKEHLEEGSIAKHDDAEHEAKGAAYVGAAGFYEWWYGLEPGIKMRISELTIPRFKKTFGQVIGDIISPEVRLVDGEIKAIDPRFCVFLRGANLNLFINNDEFKQSLLRIAKESKLPTRPFVPNEQLEYWQNRIERDLSESQSERRFLCARPLFKIHASSDVCRLQDIDSCTYENLGVLPDLFTIIQAGYSKEIARLIKKRKQFDLTVTDTYDKTPIFFAAEQHQWEIVVLLAKIEGDATGDDKEQYGAALWHAAAEKKFDICELLLRKKGVRLDAYQNTPTTLHFFVRYNQVGFIKQCCAID